MRRIAVQGKADLTKHYRQRARQMRAIAKGIYDKDERRVLLEIADEYEKLGLRSSRPVKK
jgi:hypothetical protein